MLYLVELGMRKARVLRYVRLTTKLAGDRARKQAANVIVDRSGYKGNTLGVLTETFASVVSYPARMYIFLRYILRLYDNKMILDLISLSSFIEIIPAIYSTAPRLEFFNGGACFLATLLNFHPT